MTKYHCVAVSRDPLFKYDQNNYPNGSHVFVHYNSMSFNQLLLNAITHDVSLINREWRPTHQHTNSPPPPQDFFCWKTNVYSCTLQSPYKRCLWLSLYGLLFCVQSNKANSKLNKHLNNTHHNSCYQCLFHTRCNVYTVKTWIKNNINSKNFTYHSICSTPYITKQFCTPSVNRNIINDAFTSARQAYV
jgi:hypothetical protein